MNDKGAEKWQDQQNGEKLIIYQQYSILYLQKNRIEEVPENILKLEELEAIRLKDLEGLEQDECADRMEVSRPTFQRILLVARGKVADSLINGKGICIEGGNFTRNICPVLCMDCGKEWKGEY